MVEFDAVYFDGRTSARAQVRVRGGEGGLQFLAGSVLVNVPLAGITVDPPFAGARRVLHLPGGAQIQTDDHAAVQTLFPGSNPLEGAVHAIERRWQYALAGLAAVVLFVAWALVYGLPLAAEAIAERVPRAIEAKLGEHTLRAIDGQFCARSRLNADLQQKLQKNFAVLTTGLGDGYAYRLELRNCARIGPNAFALPGGTVVLTDQLVEIGQDFPEITAVLAHEVGHVRLRHGLRTLLQGAGVAALVSALAGDAASITGLAVTLPTVLLQSGYSRVFEEQADEYALQRLEQTGGSPKAFANILKRMEEKRPTGPQAGRDYFSTHPVTSERIEHALARQTNADRARERFNRGVALAGAGKLDEAIAELDHAIAMFPKEPRFFVARGMMWSEKRDEEKALADLEQALRLGSQYPGAYNTVAWILATSEVDARRDAGRAVALARKACELTQWKDANFIDTLAAAYAEAGNFADAVRWQQAALESTVFAEAHGTEARKRLELYRAGKPYHEPRRF